MRIGTNKVLSHPSTAKNVVKNVRDEIMEKPVLLHNNAPKNEFIANKLHAKGSSTSPVSKRPNQSGEK